MYYLYYINETFQINCLEVISLDRPVLIPENLHFIALRKGIDFIDHPNECIAFNNLERLAIASRLDDLNEFSNHPWRIKNTYFTALCRVDPLPFINEINVYSSDYRDNRNYISVLFPNDVTSWTLFLSSGGYQTSQTFPALTGRNSDLGFGEYGFDYAAYNASHKIDITNLVGTAQFNNYLNLDFRLNVADVSTDYSGFTPNEGLIWKPSAVVVLPAPPPPPPLDDFVILSLTGTVMSFKVKATMPTTQYCLRIRNASDAVINNTFITLSSTERNFALDANGYNGYTFDTLFFETGKFQFMNQPATIPLSEFFSKF